MWIIASVGSAFFAGVTSILAKCGIKKTDSDVATFLRTIIVVIFSWIMVFIVGSFHTLATITMKSLIFLVLSGIATGASWLCYFKALSMGDVNKVVPIDKSSTLISVILAIVLFKETDHLVIRLISTCLLGVGIFLMIEKKQEYAENVNKKYLYYAFGSALFASLTSVLGKVGITGVESNLGTAIRTIVVLVMSYMILLIKNKQDDIKNVDKKELFFIVLSGIATGASWLCFYYALSIGVVSVVIPIDKMSILVSILFSYIVFKEKLTKKSFIGLLLMVIGTLSMTLFA